MKKSIRRLGLPAVAVAFAVAATASLVAQTSPPPAPPAPPGTPPSGSAPPGRGPGGGSGPMAELRQKIAGQEEKPAEEVFKNIQVLKGMTAGRLLRVMGGGYARSLGVQCDHCHVDGAWEKDDKPEKGIARQMHLMTKAINEEQLKKIPNLKGPDSIVNCTTCHRGQTKPALSLGDGPAGGGARPGDGPRGGGPGGPPPTPQQTPGAPPPSPR